MPEEGRLATYLSYFDIEPQMDTFQQRKKLQKLVYLMREVGLDAPFTFSWYLYGPYSPSLTRLLFEMVEQRPQVHKDNLSQDEKQRLENLKTFLGDDINSTRQLELTASLLYLKKITKGKATEDEIISTLRSKKPQFSEDEIRASWKKLETLQIPLGRPLQ